MSENINDQERYDELKAQEPKSYEEVKQHNAIGRTYKEIVLHLKTYNRTLNEEYELVQNRKSILSKRLREFVILLHDIEKHSPETTFTFDNPNAIPDIKE